LESVRIVDSLSHVDRAEWNALAGEACDRAPEAARGARHDDHLLVQRFLPHRPLPSPSARRSKRAILGSMPNIGTGEIVLLLLLALLLFGAKRLPEIGRSLGKGMREFKDSVSGRDDDEPRQLESAAVEPPVGTQDTTAPAAPREHDPV